MNQKKGGGVRGGSWEIIKRKGNIILIKKMCIIDKLIRVFCKNEGIKMMVFYLMSTNKSIS